MGTPRLTREEAQPAADAYRASGWNQSAAALSLGICRSTLQNQLRAATEFGMLLDCPAAMPGFRVKRVSSGPKGIYVTQGPEPGEPFQIREGHVVKGVSAFVDPDGNIRGQWIKTREGILDPLAVADRLKEAFEGYKPAAKPKRPPARPAESLLTVVPCADWHIGMFAWQKEASENWDLKIAEEKIGDGIADTVARSPSCAVAVMLGGGDLLHSDNKTNRTNASGAPLDVDGRWPKLLETACRLKVRAIDAALERHDRVEVRELPGNHDEHSAVAVAYFLKAWYRNEPRVMVDTDPSLFWWRRFGKVMLGATHGHTVKIGQMPQIMAHRRAEDWGQTRFRYIHGFHLHHLAKTMSEGGGCITEIHQAPIPQDAWHFGSGFLSGRSMQSITYHHDLGEVSRVRVAILDA